MARLRVPTDTSGSLQSNARLAFPIDGATLRGIQWPPGGNDPLHIGPVSSLGVEYG